MIKQVAPWTSIPGVAGSNPASHKSFMSDSHKVFIVLYHVRTSDGGVNRVVPCIRVYPLGTLKKPLEIRRKWLSYVFFPSLFGAVQI